MLALPPTAQGGSKTLALPNCSFDKRDVSFSQRVPVEEANHGVILVQQFFGAPHVPGEEIVRYDDYVRNHDWRRIGPILYTQEELTARAQALQQEAEKLGGYRRAPALWDVGPKASKFKMRNPFSDRARLSATGEFVQSVLKTEFLDEKGLQSFFSSPEAVSFEETPSV
ncbi:unnamed protein product [Durusdinium trenchii]|uniref:Uncharacterized protein n=2 Tax=Durusdinium trenchii TaxID=1381693 RepID=A0ABP0JRI4_9DINO